MPCIATFAGGTGSIMADGNEGVLIQDGDPWALSGAVVELMRDDVKSNLYGQNARNRALVRHNRELVVGQYLDIYKQILNK
jgi:glycosyltransferase involved in cell wall biosynthesis